MQPREPMVEIIPDAPFFNREFFGNFGYAHGEIIGHFHEPSDFGRKNVMAVRARIAGREYYAWPSMGHWRAEPVLACSPTGAPPWPMVAEAQMEKCLECGCNWQFTAPVVVVNYDETTRKIIRTDKRRCVECKLVYRVPVTEGIDAPVG